MKKVFIITLTFFLSFVTYAQDLPKIIPPSPNAAAFHVYGNTQLNNYTGSANISIPIYTIEEGDLSLPIYLKYTAGNGVKVEETASWVGLGWTLNAGGAISRTIRGIADEDEGNKIGFFNMTEIPIPQSDIYTGAPLNVDIFNKIKNNKADGEADKFMYNYSGGSGSFFITMIKQYIINPKLRLILHIL